MVREPSEMKTQRSGENYSNVPWGLDSCVQMWLDEKVELKAVGLGRGDPGKPLCSGSSRPLCIIPVFWARGQNPSGMKVFKREGRVWPFYVLWHALGQRDFSSWDPPWERESLVCMIHSEGEKGVGDQRKGESRLERSCFWDFQSPLVQHTQPVRVPWGFGFWAPTTASYLRARISFYIVFYPSCCRCRVLIGGAGWGALLATGAAVGFEHRELYLGGCMLGDSRDDWSKTPRGRGLSGHPDPHPKEWQGDCAIFLWL